VRRQPTRRTRLIWVNDAAAPQLPKPEKRSSGVFFELDFATKLLPEQLQTNQNNRNKILVTVRFLVLRNYRRSCAILIATQREQETCSPSPSRSATHTTAGKPNRRGTGVPPACGPDCGKFRTPPDYEQSGPPRCSSANARVIYVEIAARNPPPPPPKGVVRCLGGTR
jgi:hypothetical protein